MDLVGDAVKEIAFFLPYSSLNRLRQTNFAFLQAILRRISKLSTATIKTPTIVQLSRMADEENKLDAMKSEIEKIKRDMKADVKSIRGIKFDALAVMSTLLRKLPGEDTWPGLDFDFKIPASWMGEITAAWKDIYREVYGSQPENEQAGLGDLRDGVEHCTDEGMLKLTFHSPDGFDKNAYKLAPHTQWKSYNERKERDGSDGI